MKSLLKQPWFFILLMVASVYTYQYYKSSGDDFELTFNPQGMEKILGKQIRIGTNQAQATPTTDKALGEDEKTPVTVKVSQEFPAGRSLKFELATYYNMKVEFTKTDSKKVIVSLIGQGSDYMNDGKRLADWFIVSSAGKTLKLKSFEKKEYKNVGMKDVAKLLKSSNDKSDLTMIVEFPENHKFENIQIENVISDVFATEVSFKNFAVATVSGDVRLKDSKGQNIKIESVSGSNHVEVSDVKSAEFSSVSGDTVLVSKTTNPTLKYSSVSGDLNLKIPQDSDVDVNFESMTGDLINDFGRSKKSNKTLKFSSLSGSAKIQKIK